MSLRTGYISRDEARDFVRAHHRHHRPPQGAIGRVASGGRGKGGSSTLGRSEVAELLGAREAEAGAWLDARRDLEAATPRDERGGRVGRPRPDSPRGARPG